MTSANSVDVKCLNSESSETNWSLSSNISKSNNTQADIAGESEFDIVFAVIQTTFMIVISFIIIVGNVLNLRILPTLNISDATKVYLQVIACIDLCVGVVFGVIPLPNRALNSQTWIYGDLCCKIVGLVGAALCGLSQTMVIYLSADRYLAVVYPLRYPILLTKRRAILSLTALPLYFTPFYLLFGNENHLDNVHYFEFGICTLDMGNPNIPLTKLLTFYGIFVTTYFCVGLLYFKLFLIARSQKLKLDKLALPLSTNAQRKIKRQSSGFRNILELKATQTALLVTLAFYVTWLPFVITNLFIALTGAKVPSSVEYIVYTLVLMNSWINVFVYSYTNTEHRKAVLNAICCCRRWQFFIYSSH